MIINKFILVFLVLLVDVETSFDNEEQRLKRVLFDDNQYM